MKREMELRREVKEERQTIGSAPPPYTCMHLREEEEEVRLSSHLSIQPNYFFPSRERERRERECLSLFSFIFLLSLFNYFYLFIFFIKIFYFSLIFISINSHKFQKSIKISNSS